MYIQVKIDKKNHSYSLQQTDKKPKIWAPYYQSTKLNQCLNKGYQFQNETLNEEERKAKIINLIQDIKSTYSEHYKTHKENKLWKWIKKIFTGSSTEEKITVLYNTLSLQSSKPVNGNTSIGIKQSKDIAGPSSLTSDFHSNNTTYDPDLYQGDTIPGFEQFLYYIGIDNKLSSKEVSSLARESNYFVLQPNMMQNMRKFNMLLNPDILEEYESINQNVANLQPLAESAAELPHLPKQGIFVHTTPLNSAQDIIENGINGDYFSVSIFNPKQENTGLYYERGGIGLILEIPVESITVAHREDLLSPLSGASQQEKYLYIRFQAQHQALNHYITYIYHKSSYSKEIDQNRKELEKRFKSIESPESQEIVEVYIHTSKKRLERMIAFYEDKQKELSLEQRQEEFQTLFGKKGDDIVQELYKFYIELKKFRKTVDNLIGTNRTFGKMHKVAKMTNLHKKSDVLPTRHNELIVLSESSCDRLGLKSPNVRGILFFDNQITEEKQILLNFAQEKKLAIYYVKPKKAFKKPKSS